MTKLDLDEAAVLVLSALGMSGEAVLRYLAADSARRRAVVAALLTEEEVARAVDAALTATDDEWTTDELAELILAALRSPDPAEAPEGRS